MISRIEAKNFKSLVDIGQNLGRFNVLVGPNGSGKSAFLDVIQFFSDLVRSGLSHKKVGKLGFAFKDEAGWFSLALELRLPDRLKQPRYDTVRYEIYVDEDKDSLSLAEERIVLKSTSSQTDSRPVLYRRDAPFGYVVVASEVSDHETQCEVDTQTSALTRLPWGADKLPVCHWVRDILTNGVYRVSPSWPIGRGSDRAESSDCISFWGWRTIQDAVQSLKDSSRARYDLWLMHVREAFPYAEKMLEENVLSDGTLRFLALTLTPYMLRSDIILLVEEPESGIYPGDLELVFQSLTSVYGGQVFCTTYSPYLLNMLEPDDLSGLLCFLKGDDEETKIVPAVRHPLMKSFGYPCIGDLFACGALVNSIARAALHEV